MLGRAEEGERGREGERERESKRVSVRESKNERKRVNKREGEKEKRREREGGEREREGRCQTLFLDGETADNEAESDVCELRQLKEGRGRVKILRWK